MLSGDLSTMSLADLLQWADSTRARGVLTIERPSGPFWMHIEERHVIGCVRPPSRPILAAHLGFDAQQSDAGIELDAAVLAVELLYDQLLDPEDRFVFEPDATPREAGVQVEVALQEVVMTGMQYVDEWPFVRDLYPSGSARMERLEGPEPPSLSALQTAVLRLAPSRLTLDDARLHLGVSHPALLRNVDLLRRLGCVRVEGAPDVQDLSEQLVRKATLLVHAKQFDEAAHVFAALLSTEPGSRRIRELLRWVDREHATHLYERLPARAIVRRRPRFERVAQWLTRADREVVDRINDLWDVATLVLSCATREVETLKSLAKLQRLEAIELVLPSERPASSGPRRRRRAAR